MSDFATKVERKKKKYNITTNFSLHARSIFQPLS